MQSLISIGLSLVSLAAIAEVNDKPTVAEAYEQAASLNEASFVTEIVFNKGSSELSADGKSQLRDILKAAQGRGKVEEIKVLSWADKDYPPKGHLGNDAMKLADERNQEIEGYLTDTYKGIDVDGHNMAGRPSELDKIFKSQDMRVKRSLERAGLSNPQKSGMPSKASRALVMVIVR